MKAVRPHLLIAAALVAAGLLLWHRSGSDPEPAVAAATSAPAPVTDRLALRAEMAQLHARIDNVRADLAAQTGERAPTEGAPVQASGEPAKTEAPAPVSDPYADLPPAERDMAIAGDLEAYLAAEAIDSEWRAETEALIASAVADTGGVELVSMQCRSTLCQVELSHPSIDERERAVRELTRTPAFATEGFVHMRDSDPPESAIYFTRPGHHLPRPGLR